VTYTYDLVAKAQVANFYQGTNAVVSTAKCNLCHDALSTTFHEPSYSGNVTVCRTCHVTTSGGAHLEMQSRGIDSYVHAIHRFQYFDTNSVDFSNPVFAKRYQLHVEHGFPNFTIKNCEACHTTSSSTVPVNYNPPSQTKSMPGIESASWTLTKGWVDLATGKSLPPPATRTIGNIPSYVVGPANRACGGCHRGILINEDAEGELVSFNSHTAMGGYTIANGKNSSGVDYVYLMIEKMMNYYK
jgi:OmcA/MtrC family decaheme c-type cytochrome